jgi:hypothetical protein
MFLLGVLLDVLWTLCVRSVAEKRALSAGLYQALFTVFAVAATWYVVEGKDLRSLLAYSLGCGVGTWAIVKWKSHRSTKDT